VSGFDSLELLRQLGLLRTLLAAPRMLRHDARRTSQLSCRPVRSVAEDRGWLVADPVPQRRRASEAGVGDELAFVELA
jgi:hypothetical protein